MVRPYQRIWSLAAVIVPSSAHADHAEAAGLAYDENVACLSLLCAFCWLGWNKALNAAGPTPVVREREQQDVNWWVQQAGFRSTPDCCEVKPLIT